MPGNCAVFGCFSSSKKKNVSLHSFPKEENIRKRWIHLCKRQDSINVNNAKICSLHFEENAFQRHLKYELLNLPVPAKLVRIKQDALPTLLLPSSKGKGIPVCV